MISKQVYGKKIKKATKILVLLMAIICLNSVRITAQRQEKLFEKMI